MYILYYSLKSTSILTTVNILKILQKCNSLYQTYQWTVLLMDLKLLTVFLPPNNVQSTSHSLKEGAMFLFCATDKKIKADGLFSPEVSNYLSHFWLQYLFLNISGMKFIKITSILWKTLHLKCKIGKPIIFIFYFILFYFCLFLWVGGGCLVNITNFFEKICDVTTLLIQRSNIRHK